MLIATLLMGAAQAADADCTETFTTNEVNAVLQEALLSFASLDQETFESKAGRALEQVDCLDETITPSLAAALHRAEGIRLVVTGNDNDAHERFRAALSLDPAHVLAEAIAPEGGKLADAYSAGRALPIRDRLPLPVPSMVTTIVDGHEVADRPDQGPYVLQVLDLEGGIVTSDYVLRGEPSLDLPASLLSSAPVKPGTEIDPAVAVAEVPGSESANEPAVAEADIEGSEDDEPVAAPAPVIAATPPAPVPITTSSSTTRQKKGGKGLLVAGLASGVVAGGLYGTAVGARMQFDDNPTETAWYVTNGAYFGAVGTGALSAVLMSTFIVTR